MSDSLLIEALSEARDAIEELAASDAPVARELRLRASLLERASAIMNLRPAKRDEIVALAKLTMELRDDAVELRRRHRHVRTLIEHMMD